MARKNGTTKAQPRRPQRSKAARHASLLKDPTTAVLNRRAVNLVHQAATR